MCEDWGDALWTFLGEALLGTATLEEAFLGEALWGIATLGDAFLGDATCLEGLSTCSHRWCTFPIMVYSQTSHNWPSFPRERVPRGVSDALALGEGRSERLFFGLDAVPFLVADFFLVAGITWQGKMTVRDTRNVLVILE